MFLLALPVTNRYSYLPMVKIFLPSVAYRNIGHVCKPEAIVRPTAVIVSDILSRLSRLSGLALNIWMSDILSVVAVPTICRIIEITFNK